MKCQNCGKNEANVRYTQIVNGNKIEMNLCENCARELGIDRSLHFDMAMDIPSFFGNFFHEYDDFNLLPSFQTKVQESCDHCGMTYNDFVNTGRLGCIHCYDIFSDRLDPILKNIQGSNRHIGRKGKVLDSSIVENMEKQKEKVEKQNKEVNKIETLKRELKQAIKEEKYEDAAKLRDEINGLENNK